VGRNPNFITAFTSACPYPEPDRSSPYLPFPLLEDLFVILFSHLRQGLRSGLLLSGLRNEALYEPFLSPISATFPDHLILLDLISRMIYSEEYTA